jgi:hypothetical protein
MDSNEQPSWTGGDGPDKEKMEQVRNRVARWPFGLVEGPKEIRVNADLRHDDRFGPDVLPSSARPRRRPRSRTSLSRPMPNPLNPPPPRHRRSPAKPRTRSSLRSTLHRLHRPARRRTPSASWEFRAADRPGSRRPPNHHQVLTFPPASGPRPKETLTVGQPLPTRRRRRPRASRTLPPPSQTTTTQIACSRASSASPSTRIACR